MSLKVNLGKLKLKNPVVLASGTFDKSILEKIDVSKLGGVITKTITLEPRLGNPLPHIYKSKYGWLNSVGLKNPGIKKYLADELPFWRQFDTEVITSIGGNSQEEYFELAKLLNEKIRIVELNVSCPNVEHGGMAFGTDPKILGRLIKKIRSFFKGTIIAKLSPNVTDITQIANAALTNGADIISLTNTFLGLEINNKTKKPIFHRVVAGYSGGAIKPISLRMVYQVYQKFKCPIIASGGIESFSDALDYFMVGANAIAIGASNFLNPKLSVNIVGELEKYLKENKISNIKKITGVI